METESIYYEDKSITCRDCQEDFLWSGGEQRFYAAHDYDAPRRCKPCREERKARRAQQKPS